MVEEQSLFIIQVEVNCRVLTTATGRPAHSKFWMSIVAVAVFGIIMSLFHSKLGAWKRWRQRMMIPSHNLQILQTIPVQVVVIGTSHSLFV